MSDSFTLDVKRVVFHRRGGTVGITLIPEKQPEGTGDTLMFGIDVDDSSPMAALLDSLRMRAEGV